LLHGHHRRRLGHGIQGCYVARLEGDGQDGGNHEGAEGGVENAVFHGDALLVHDGGAVLHLACSGRCRKLASKLRGCPEEPSSIPLYGVCSPTRRIKCCTAAGPETGDYKKQHVMRLNLSTTCKCLQ